MQKLKKMLLYLAVTALGLYSLPPLFATGSGMGLMLFALPAVIGISSFIYGMKNRFHWTYLVYAVIVSALFFPTIFIYYNFTATVYTAIFGVIALAGIFLGRIFAIPVH